MKVTEELFGVLHGKTIKSYTIKNDTGMELTCIDYGCIITKIQVPDKDGNLENIVLGFDSVDEYVNYSPYFGCTIGRNAGRIKNAAFQLDGVTYSLPKNDGENNLHSGPNGFHNVIWQSKVQQNDHEVNIIFTYTSPDGEEGFPGTLQTTVSYTINNDNQLVISYMAMSDKKTIVNLTNHSYFNLSGDLKRSIVDHKLTMNSDYFLELDDSFIPTGRKVPVDGTVFDFRKGRQIIEGTHSEDQQTKIVGGGYDHPFLLNVSHQNEIVLEDETSGRKVIIETDEPAVILYTGNSLTTDFTIRGRQSEKHLGLCLETQKAPNMIDHPDFPTIVLEANQPYISKTTYSFSAE